MLKNECAVCNLESRDFSNYFWESTVQSSAYPAQLEAVPVFCLLMVAAASTNPVLGTFSRIFSRLTLWRDLHRRTATRKL
jgi:hypothetical protein